MKDYVTVKKLSQGILNFKYYNIYWKGSFGEEGYEYTVDIELDDGSIITNAVKIGSYIRSKYGKIPVVDKPAERIIDAINRLGIEGKIKQIIINRNGYRYYNNQRKTWTELTIYIKGVKKWYKEKIIILLKTYYSLCQANSSMKKWVY